MLRFWSGLDDGVMSFHCPTEQITKALLGIQDSFEAQIDKLRNLDYTVLDVTTSRWHDDYNSFKDVVKDLEVVQQP